MYSLNLDKDGRILSACVVLPNGTYENVVNNLPTGETDKEKDITNWKVVGDKYVYDPLPDPEPIAEEPTQLDRVEAQVTYTAMMTDTLLEV